MWQIQALFDYLLDVREESVAEPLVFWGKLASQFLVLDWKRKGEYKHPYKPPTKNPARVAWTISYDICLFLAGKYKPLISITSRLGADFLLHLYAESPSAGEGGLLSDVILALAYSPVASVAAALLEALLLSLMGVRSGKKNKKHKKEKKDKKSKNNNSSNSKAPNGQQQQEEKTEVGGSEVVKATILPPLLAALASTDAKVQVGILDHALPTYHLHELFIIESIFLLKIELTGDLPNVLILFLNSYLFTGADT